MECTFMKYNKKIYDIIFTEPCHVNMLSFLTYTAPPFAALLSIKSQMQAAYLLVLSLSWLVSEMLPDQNSSNLHLF